MHAVGGLDDTVIDADADVAADAGAVIDADVGVTREARAARTPAGAGRAAPRPGTAGTGFVFRQYRPEALLDAITRALAAFADARRWKALQVAGMQQD